MDEQELSAAQATPKEVYKHTVEQKSYELKPFSGYQVAGNIGSVSRFLAQMAMGIVLVETPSTVNPKDSIIIVDRDGMEVRLAANVSDPYTNRVVAGSLERSKWIGKFRLNVGESWDHKKLGEFIKMNRACFEDRNDAMKLAANLMDIKVKTDREYESMSDNRGTERFMVAQRVIQSNIPERFKLCVPIFKGEARRSFEVEVYVNASNYDVTLVSPELEEIIQTESGDLIDKEVEAIEGLELGIPIIYK
jgi:hypothetical protein